MTRTTPRPTALPSRPRHVARLARAALLALAGLGAAQSGQAAILSFFGWGFSENETYKEVMSYVDAAGNVLGAVGVFHPPAGAAGLTIKAVKVAVEILDPDSFNAIVSGRATLAFDPSYQVLAAGWFGEFGADPALLAPPVPVPTHQSGIDLLQTTANTAMASAGISVAPGQVVFEFDWGAPGFVPQAHVSADGHFNFAGLYLYSPDFANATVGSAANVVSVVGSAAQTATLGTASSTYMLCASGYCGVNPIPEPSSWALMVGGLAAVAVADRRRRSR